MRTQCSITMPTGVTIDPSVAIVIDGASADERLGAGPWQPAHARVVEAKLTSEGAILLTIEIDVKPDLRMRNAARGNPACANVGVSLRASEQPPSI
jgi:hypothetical protein